ncbi:MAG: M55 family metallopeptidase [Fervidobacterium sp.]|mgnify:CR=1 FL=1|uniref:D-aminopeptidase DppA. Metallo peptidase. MEROPS family M55 n=1 Tax=Fervidobacterium gondwanense DSM 13020 TaxID=1121883 RepID=A0A1M7RWE2_FERGO|nr:M55 family metallopeptidase [Fervidobacterium gondwanense]UXF00018.1 peptidase M55 [Fervidobacterium riparium]SHN50322.1 D-aminopeptidase DppA. Metallo peptidase. MEROPS family M55 [Fervidobacterium gondwanense DSM 13020]
MKRIYISFDFEGLAGITSWSDVDKRSPDYKRKEMLTQLRAFLSGLGDCEITLVDSHASGDNIPWEITDEFPNVNLVSGGIRPYYMMYGIDSSFDFAVFFGYHAGIGTLNANMDHTYSSSSIHNIWINGIAMNEALINAAYAGLYGVPVGCIVGDDKVVEQTKPLLNKTIYIQTKTSIGRHSAIMKPMKNLLQEIEETAKVLSKKERSNFEIFTFKSPVEMLVEFSDTLRADLVSSMPLVERLDGRRVRIMNDDYKVIFEALLAMTYICAAARILI